MSIVKNAVKESRDVARLAVDAAKNELIEQLTPTIQAIIDGQLRRGALGRDVAALQGEGVNRLRQAAGGYDGITDFEEGVDMKKNKDDKMESVAALFPGVNEVAEDVTEGGDYGETDEAIEQEAGDPDAGGDVAAEGADEMDEALELSESELEQMYAEALQLEVDVKKGFGDMQKPHELGAGAKYDSTKEQGALPTDLKSGQHYWENEEPPAKQDFTVKEIRRLVKRGMKENRQLTVRNAKLTEMVQALHGKLTEMNLLNSKILHVNKFMAAHRLNNEQKKTVIESIDRGQSVKEVKSIFSILESSFRSSGAVTEGRRGNTPRADTQRRRTTGATTPHTQVLRESADKAEGGGYGRWQQLAGLTNGRRRS
jgi:hypothetical protein